ncbi:MAG: HupE/UreJ family protein [Bacteroidetes bacterium]|nr:HupE/UreJ family protein [Bacteroidota bacterium]
MEDFGLYFKTGWSHIISTEATDHILFLIALAAVYSFRHISRVLILVTAFTIGHSLTLALSATNVISFKSEVVEFLIPVTIVITAAYNIFGKINFHYKVNYILALLFGLVHGMGFANTIKFMLAESQSLTIPLLSFNLGIEAGQIVLVALILLLQYIFVSKFKISEKWWVNGISIVPLVWGFIMAVERLNFDL